MNQFDHFELDREDAVRELRVQDRATRMAWAKHFAHPDPRDPDYSPAPVEVASEDERP